jgi:hypothetical protein
MGGQDAHPTRKKIELFRNRLSGLFLKMVQDVSFHRF